MPTPPRLLTLGKITKSLTEWATTQRIGASTIRQRLDEFGWTVERALTTPPDSRFRSSRAGRPAANVPRPCPVMIRHQGGQACVRWMSRGRSFQRYLGAWGSDAARTAYTRFSIEWARGMAEIKSATGGVLVVELVAGYLTYARGHYRKGDRPTGELSSVIAAANVLASVVGEKFTDQLLPDDLRACQESMIARGLARSTINSHCGRILRCLSWGVAHTTATGRPFVPPDVLAVLREVERLGAHRTAAREPKKVGAVPWAIVEATIPHLHDKPGRQAILEALVRTHWLTGMRSSALLAMRSEDIDRTAGEWKYVVGDNENKNAHRGGHGLTVFIGPRAQAILSPLLATTTPGIPVFHFTNARTGEPLALDKNVYGRLVRLACSRAGVQPWHPHQLRHSRATEVQRIYESDGAAAAAIGDTEEVTRRVYVDPSEVVRRRIARETG